MSKFLYTFMLAALVVAAQAQNHQHGAWCGTYGPEVNELMMRRLAQNKAALEAYGSFARGGTQYVPIKFHLVADNSGAGRVSEAIVLGQLCELNEDYASLGIQFFLKDGTFNYVNNTTVFSNHNGAINTIMTFQRNARALNIWIVDAIPDEDPNNGQTLAYYSPVKDWIVARKANVGPNDATLSHEVGHFFDLSHPFLGWDAAAYDPAVHGTPAPAMSPGGVPTELASGANCATAGDGICDTPADYNLGLGWSNCNYTGGARDPNNQLVNPEERLYMGYFLNCPDEEYIFSPMQQEIMLADLASSARNYLRQDPVPAISEIEAGTTLLAPEDATTLAGYNQVNFSWTAVPGATAYLLEISRVSTFTINPIRTVVYGTNKIITGLEANKTYYWRVRPFNAHRACQTPTPNGTFTTGTLTDVETPAGVVSHEIAPNPIRSGESLRVTIVPETSVTGHIQLFDLTGRAVTGVQTHRFTTVESTVSMDVAQLSAGIYLLNITTDNGQLTEKVVITR